MATVKRTLPQIPGTTWERLKLAVERHTYKVDSFSDVSDMWDGQKMGFIDFGTQL